jgi:hypothetical protein
MLRTRLEKWKYELSAELDRLVTYEELADESGVAYSTLQKHVGHAFRRPDYATAKKICDAFNRLSGSQTRSPDDYFFYVDEEDGPGQAVAVAVG